MKKTNLSHNLLIFTFWIPRGIIAQTLFPLKEEIKILYISGDRGLRSLELQIVKNRPEYLLGLGYYRKGTKKIRSEKLFRNIYGKSEINPGGKEYYNATWLIEDDQIVQTNNAGTSRCNQFAYKAAEIIDREGLTTKFAYLHMPPDYSQKLFAANIDKVINHFNNV